MPEDQIPSFEDTTPVEQPAASLNGGLPNPRPQNVSEPELEATKLAAQKKIPSFEETTPVGSEKYESYGQEVLGAAESLGKGLLGHTLTAGAEKLLTKAGVPGLTPEEQAGREEYLGAVNPALPALGEAAGFGLGAISGTGIAPLVGKAGVAAAGLTKAGQAVQAAQAAKTLAPLSARLTVGATKAATELAALQADTELSRSINGTSKGVGDAVANVGLAGLIGGVGGGALTGLGAAGKGAVDAVGLKELVDRLAFRGANAHPAEMIEKEFGDAYQQIRNMGSELGGVNGVGAAARENLMPQLNDGMVNQARNLAERLNKAASALEKAGDKSGALGQMRNQAEKIEAAINREFDPISGVAQNEIKPGNIYDTLNSVKRQLGEWGQFEKDMVPLAEQPFRNAAKSMGAGFKEALEDTEVWGKVGDLQKTVNEAWHQTIGKTGALRDAEKQFMQKVMGEYTIDPTKFATYLKQNGKVTTESIRQQRMGNFVDAVEKMQKAVADAYEKAGLENPHPVLGMGTLKDSLKKQSMGSKLGDLLYDKINPAAMGEALGMGVGATIAPGIPGVYAGRWALGPAFTALIKPIWEKGSSLKGFQGAMSFMKQVAEGNNKLAKAVGGLFEGGAKTLPGHWLPDGEKISDLDEKLKKAQSNQASLLDVSGDLPHYMPEHAQELSKTAMNAVSVLNSMRPSNPKMSPLDAEIPPSKAQEADFHRALTIAEQPLVVFQHIQEGTLLPSDVNALKTLYPEYYQKMSEQVMVQMADHLHAENDIPYKVRQGLSLFLGQPLDTTMTPTSIQSIQATYAKAAPQPQQQGGQKGNTSKLGKSTVTAMQTQGQAREMRRNA